jgi:hypothetical protein
MRVRSGLVVALTVAACAVMAMPTFTPIVSTLYKPKKDGVIAKATCALCHTSKTSFKTLNPYGADVKKALDAAKSKKLTPDVLKSLEALDSDKDGVKNGDELKKDTLPGDPKSK